ncbi:MAG: YceI family protein [Myxococcaceae bacterium]
MKRHILTAALILTPAFAFAATSSWEIDPSHSSAAFTVKHMMVTNVRGEFRKVSGKIDLDDKDVTKSTVDATIDATSIDTNEPKRDGHLKSPDFFDVEKYPTITFKSTKVAKGGPNKLKVTGDLTIHGVTKPVVLDVQGPSPVMKDPWGNEKRAVMATTKISRKDFGLNWNKTMESGGVLVGDDVNIELNLELGKSQPANTAETKAETKTDTKMGGADAGMKK